MPTTCQFKFSRTTPMYYSGEQITGSITLSTSKQLPVEAIQISLVGSERVQWLEKSKGALVLQNDSIEQHYKEPFNGKQELLCESYTLTKGVRLQAGEVRVEDFAFTLANDAPASCEMDHGGVVYWVILVLQRKSVFNKVFKARITVKNRLDLSNATELGEPHKLTIIGPNMPSDAPESVPLNFILFTGTGYVPGQNIIYTLQGRHSFATCNKLRVNLCELSTLRATSPQTKIKNHLKVLKSDVQKIALSNVMACGQLSIPLVARISLQNNENNLIQTSHYVEAMFIKRKRILQKLVIPIVIGTVPPTKKQQTHEKKFLDEEEHFYCYDNLANDAYCDRSIENYDLLNDCLSKLPSTWILNSYPTSKSMLQQHVATDRSQLMFCKADALINLQLPRVRQDCLS